MTGAGMTEASGPFDGGPGSRPVIRIKRVYDVPVAADGTRILVDRLWPRGMSHQRAGLDEWFKEIAPTPELRTWWKHDPARMTEFAARYRHELDTRPQAREAVERVLELAGQGRVVTLVYAAKDERVNHARILAQYLRDA